MNSSAITVRWNLFWLIVLGAFVNPLFAQDKSAQTDQNSEKKQSEEEKKETEKDDKKAIPGQPSLLDRLTKELMKEIDDSPKPKPAADREDKLDRAARGMQSAGDKLGESKTGEETRKIQEQVIRDLDDLIKQLQQPPPNGGGGGGGGGGAGASRGAAGGGGRMGQQQLQNSGSAGLNGKKQEMSHQRESQKPGRNKNDKGDSVERTDAEPKGSEEANRKKKLEMDVWGHLPAHLREELVNKYGERMLPKYEQLVKQFYEALSQQSDGGRR